jgi:hypothetical protein
MREMLPTWAWPTNVMDLTNHFIEAQKICYENRNKLVHSNLISNSAEAIFLYKPQRDGNIVLACPSIKELQKVADDMHIYYGYELHLSNMIRFEILKHQRMPGDLSFPTWPDKPSLPTPLDYTSAPFLKTAQ